MRDTKKLVDVLIGRYKTNNPYMIAKRLHIRVSFEHLGNSKGHYTYLYRLHTIHINCDIPKEEQKFACAHELGHVIKHPYYNANFFKRFTYYLGQLKEIDANDFAIELLFVRAIEPIALDEAIRLYGAPKQLLIDRLHA